MEDTILVILQVSLYAGSLYVTYRAGYKSAEVDQMDRYISTIDRSITAIDTEIHAIDTDQWYVYRVQREEPPTVEYPSDRPIYPN